MGKYQRDRGHGFEREIVNVLRESFSRPDIARQLGQARDGGGDIIVDDVLFECKRVKTLKGVYGWMQQAIKAAKGLGRVVPPIPVVVVRADNEQALAILPFDMLKVLLYDCNAIQPGADPPPLVPTPEAP